MTLGRHGAVTPETARRRAMALISEAKGGKDPAADLRDKGRKAFNDEGSRQSAFWKSTSRFIASRARPTSTAVR